MVPLALLDEEWLAGKNILLLEPRRLAARLSATYMAGQMGEQVGETVGYRVRFDTRVGSRTRVEVLTEGVLTRRLQQDPELSGVGLVIFDEFHERSLESDLALALCLDSRDGLREDLRLLVMSATMDTDSLARLIPGTAVIHGQGTLYPVSVRFSPPRPDLDTGRPDHIAINTAAAIRRALAEVEGDILAFLPGSGEIRQTGALLASRQGKDALLVLPLYGNLDLADQARAVSPDPKGRRRVILATTIAETSITIEGITTVVDCGWKRVPRFDPNSGLTRLVTVRISRASARQRQGRAGRLGPGVCFRLWSTGVEHSLADFDRPEILQADLAPLALELANWGIGEQQRLNWLDPPPAGAFAQARTLLADLDALDARGLITPLGRKMAGLPLHPRLAHMVLVAADHGSLGLACELAALLSERDIIRNPVSADMEDRLHLLEVFRRQGAAAVRATGGDASSCRRIIKIGRQLRELTGRQKGPGKNVLSPGALIALAFPDRIGGRRPQTTGEYKLASGPGARLPAHDRLAASPFLAIAAMDAGRRDGRIFLAASIDPEEITELFGERFQADEEVVWDGQRAVVTARRLIRIDQLILAEHPLTDPDPEAVRRALLTGIARSGLGLLPWDAAARSLQARVLCLRRWLAEENLPDLSDAHLSDSLEKWLAPYVDGMRSANDLKRLDLKSILAGLLDWPQRQLLDREAPTHIRVPSGSRIKVQYTPGEPPVLAVRLQEMFGLAETPTVARGRVPLTLHLLSPARRPIQITGDLRGFWNNTYREVKKELKGRYPKHHWPDDPWQAEATAKVKPRKR